MFIYLLSIPLMVGQTAPSTCPATQPTRQPTSQPAMTDAMIRQALLKQATELGYIDSSGRLLRLHVDGDNLSADVWTPVGIIHKKSDSSSSYSNYGHPTPDDASDMDTDATVEKRWDKDKFTLGKIDAFEINNGQLVATIKTESRTWSFKLGGDSKNSEVRLEDIHQADASNRNADFSVTAFSSSRLRALERAESQHGAPDLSKIFTIEEQPSVGGLKVYSMSSTDPDLAKGLERNILDTQESNSLLEVYPAVKRMLPLAYAAGGAFISAILAHAREQGALKPQAALSQKLATAQATYADLAHQDAQIQERIYQADSNIAKIDTNLRSTGGMEIDGASVEVHLPSGMNNLEFYLDGGWKKMPEQIQSRVEWDYKYEKPEYGYHYDSRNGRNLYAYTWPDVDVAEDVGFGPFAGLPGIKDSKSLQTDLKILDNDRKHFQALRGQMSDPKVSVGQDAESSLAEFGIQAKSTDADFKSKLTAAISHISKLINRLEDYRDKKITAAWHEIASQVGVATDKPLTELSPRVLSKLETLANKVRAQYDKSIQENNRLGDAARNELAILAPKKDQSLANVHQAEAELKVAQDQSTPLQASRQMADDTLSHQRIALLLAANPKLIENSKAPLVFKSGGYTPQYQGLPDLRKKTLEKLLGKTIVSGAQVNLYDPKTFSKVSFAEVIQVKEGSELRTLWLTPQDKPAAPQELLSTTTAPDSILRDKLEEHAFVPDQRSLSNFKQYGAIKTGLQKMGFDVADLDHVKVVYLPFSSYSANTDTMAFVLANQSAVTPYFQSKYSATAGRAAANEFNDLTIYSTVPLDVLESAGYEDVLLHESTHLIDLRRMKITSDADNSEIKKQFKKQYLEMLNSVRLTQGYRDALDAYVKDHSELYEGKNDSEKQSLIRALERMYDDTQLKKLIPKDDDRKYLWLEQYVYLMNPAETLAWRAQIRYLRDVRKMTFSQVRDHLMYMAGNELSIPDAWVEVLFERWYQSNEPMVKK